MGATRAAAVTCTNRTVQAGDELRRGGNSGGVRTQAGRNSGDSGGAHSGGTPAAMLKPYKRQPRAHTAHRGRAEQPCTGVIHSLHFVSSLERPIFEILGFEYCV